MDNEKMSALGGDGPLEIERKYLIAYPDISWLESRPDCQRVEIEQTYLVSAGGEEVRVRRRGADGRYTYFLTVKRKISDIKRVEVENEITEEIYRQRLLDADPAKNTIRKTRYILSTGARRFEIDVYPFWQKQAIMEIELDREDETISLPEGIRVLCEVTDDPRYKNAALATQIPNE